MNSVTTGLLIFDISDVRRYRKFYKIMDCFQYRRIQKSVIEIEESEERIEIMLERLRKLIEDTEENVCYIPLCSEDMAKITDLGVVISRESMEREYFVL